MPIYDVECKVEREMVCFSKAKAVKTVLNTALCLVEIVEQAISHMMKNEPAVQIMFDGYTVGEHPVLIVPILHFCFARLFDFLLQVG